MRAALRGFVDAFRRPGTLVALALAEILSVSLVAAAASLALRARASARAFAFALGLGVAASLLGRALRACVLTGALVRVVRGATPDAGASLARGLRVFALDVCEIALGVGFAALLVAAGAAALRRGSAAAFAAVGAPVLLLSLTAFATFRVATLEVALLGAPPTRALGRAFAHVLGAPGALVAAALGVAVLALPLEAAAAAAATPGPLATACASAATLWGYAALARVRWA